MPAIYHEGSWLGNATDHEVLVKDTVGWTGKNLLKNTATLQTVSGVTITANADGTVKINGTATSDIIEEIGRFAYIDNTVILSGCPAGGAWNTYRLDIRNDNNIQYGNYTDTGSGVEFTPDSSYLKVCIRIANGTTVNNLTFYPMLRDASITDDTYEPYHESVEEEIEQIYADNGVLGAKNLLPISLSTRTENGVTVTVNKDSNGNVLSVVLNGTSTNSGQFNLNNTSGLLNSLLQKYGDLIWSGCPSRTDCRMYTHISGGSYVRLTNNEEKILSASNNYDANILIQYDNGVTYNNVTFYPMLRLASDPDDTYQPYAMTNRELTEYNKGFNFLKFLFNADGSDIYSGNLNDLHAGYAYYSSAAVNVPSDNFGYCITLERPSSYNYAVQIAINVTGDSANMYVRKKSSNTWGAWKTVTMS